MDIYFGTYRRGKKITRNRMERRRKIIALQFRGKEILKKVFSSMFAIHFDSSGRRTKKARLIGINFDMNKKKASAAGDSWSVILRST